jgi:beta-lactamase regulating signal transducer with metallopeptidase domain
LSGRHAQVPYSGLQVINDALGILVTRDRRWAKKLFNRPHILNEGSNSVAPLLAILLLIVILGILGFAVVKFLLWIAVILLIIWVIGFFVRGVEGARWYRW